MRERVGTRKRDSEKIKANPKLKQSCGSIKCDKETHAEVVRQQQQQQQQPERAQFTAEARFDLFTGTRTHTLYNNTKYTHSEWSYWSFALFLQFDSFNVNASSLPFVQKSVAWCLFACKYVCFAFGLHLMQTDGGMCVNVHSHAHHSQSVQILSKLNKSPPENESGTQGKAT